MFMAEDESSDSDGEGETEETVAREPPKRRKKNEPDSLPLVTDKRKKITVTPVIPLRPASTETRPPNPNDAIDDGENTSKVLKNAFKDGTQQPH